MNRLMSAQPLHASIIRLASTSVPDSLHLLFDRVRLAEPPVSVADLHYDTRITATTEKVLLAFQAIQADVNLLVLLSPALREKAPITYDDRLHLRTAPADGPAADDAPPGACEYVMHEPDHPWWQPALESAGRRWIYETTDFDYVEVIVDDAKGRVLLRATNQS